MIYNQDFCSIVIWFVTSDCLFFDVSGRRAWGFLQKENFITFNIWGKSSCIQLPVSEHRGYFEDAKSAERNMQAAAGGRVASPC